MKVLFVVRGKNENSSISPFIKSQAESLSEQNITVEFFKVYGKGITAYLTSAKKLRKFIKKYKFDLIHAHYALCGWTAVLAASGKPVIVSFMGSDVLGEYVASNRITLKSRIVVFLTFLLQFFVDSIISKSPNIHKKLILKKRSVIIPNGVNTDLFFNKAGVDLKNELGLTGEKKYILFLGNPEDSWKNIDLAKEAIKMTGNDQIELLVPYPITHEKVAKYLNASDLLIVTSYMEGSPNVIKEAMACNCPIVSTDVGDVKWVIGNVQGCYLSSFNPNHIAELINAALKFGEIYGRTKGYNRIIDLGLDSKTISAKIISVYKRLIL